MLILLMLFWLILSGQFAVFFLIAAAFSVIAIILIDKKLFVNSPVLVGIKYSWLVFTYILLKEIFLSTLNVLKFIWLKPKAITPCYGWLEVKSKDPISQIIYANSITLTPGTMTMDLKDNKILVHALNLEDMHNSQLEQSVLKLESK